MFEEQSFVYFALFILVVLILVTLLFIISGNGGHKKDKLVPVSLKEEVKMLIEPLIVSTPDPSILLSLRHGFLHAHRLNKQSIANIPNIRDKFSKTALENGSIYYLMGVGEYKVSQPEFPVDPRSFAPANIRNPNQGSFDGNAVSEIAEILTYDGEAPSHIQTPHDFIHLNYIGECKGKHLYYVLGSAKFKPPLVKK